MEETSTIKLGRLDELDGLRGLLALWVAVSHIVCLTGASDIRMPAHFALIWSDLTQAQPAVETFIILSGFAISFLLHARPQSYLEFMTGRFFRIVPVYFICLALGTLVALQFMPWLLSHASWRNCGYFVSNLQSISTSTLQHPLAHLAWHLILLHGVIPSPLLSHSATALLPPAWSISLEWQYYLLAPLIARLVRSNVAVLAMLSISLVSMRIGSAFPMHAFLPQRLDLFLVGIGSYHLYVCWIQSGEKGGAWALRLVAVAFGVAMFSETHALALAIWAIVFGATFVSGRQVLPRILLALRGVLLLPALQYLGRWSYPLYLVHLPLIVLGLCLLIHVSPDIATGRAMVVMLVACLPVIIMAAAALHYLLEAPLMRVGRRLTHRRPVLPQHPELKKIS